MRSRWGRWHGYMEELEEAQIANQLADPGRVGLGQGEGEVLGAQEDRLHEAGVVAQDQVLRRPVGGAAEPLLGLEVRVEGPLDVRGGRPEGSARRNQDLR